MTTSTTKHHVVVWDPAGEFWEGSIVDAARAHRLEQPPRCAVTMPTTPEMFRMSGVGGYAKRSWGGGVQLGGLIPQIHCPLTVFLHPEVRGMHWRARLVRDAADPHESLSGVLRFAADNGQRAPTKATFRDTQGEGVSAKALGPEHPEGGWVVGGEGVVMMQGEGHAGFCLYGMAPGLRCVWLAATMTQQAR